MEVVSLIISSLAFFFSVWQFCYEKKRNRSEATIHAFDDLEENVFSKEEYNDKLVLLAGKEVAKNVDGCYSRKATLFLSRIEHFSVGVNSGVYDLVVLNRMAGAFIIKQYSKWSPYIETKRQNNENSKYYDEFEKLHNSLIELRKNI